MALWRRSRCAQGRTKGRRRSVGLVARWLAFGVGFAAASYAAYIGLTWYRYGQVRDHTDADDQDALLDTFMPDYEVVERHRVRIAAPADGACSLRFRAARS